LSIRSCARRTAASALHLMVAAAIVACGLRGADAFATAPMRLQRAKLAARSRFPARGNLGLSMRKLQNDMFTEEEREMYQEGINKVLKANKNLHSHFEVVREQEFFRYYAVDLLSSCTYFPTVEFPCEMERCDVDSAEDVRDDMRERDQNEHDFRLDGWVRWDMPGDFTDYYDLIETPEKYTGYDGSNVWHFIRHKICFQVSLDDPENNWKRDFNRVISGLHTSISANIIDSMEFESDEEALVEYQRRIGDVPGAVANLYYAYMVMLCAVYEASGRLSNCSYMGTYESVLPSLNAIIQDPVLTDPAIQMASTALKEHAQGPSAKVWKARLRTRDLLGVMNCVQCNRCRLHGKVASLGLGVAFQVLLGNADGTGVPADSQGRVEKLHRIEVAALITTAAKFAKAVKIVSSYESKL